MKAAPKLALLGLLLSTTSCRTVGFYSQAVGGQVEIFAKRQPVEKVAAASDDAELKHRLALTQRLLAFAESELDMPSHGSFEQYADLGRDHVVWVVHAAPELSLEKKRWWYPVVGCQSYRGYFSATGAEKETRRLEAAGYETWTSKVDAYSTLGYFRDPLLNTYIRREEVDLAELIFHELTHQRYYLRGNTAFNEAMAEAVAREAVRQWFVHTGRPDMVRRYEARLDRVAQARQAIGNCANELQAIYATSAPDEVKRRKKAAAITDLKARLQQLRGEWGRGLKSWIDGEINNPRLNSFTTYEQDVPRFTHLLKDCDQHLPTFWTRVKTLQP